MMHPIKKILKRDFKNCGISNKNSFILAQTAYNEYLKFKNLLDNDYETEFINADNRKEDPIDVKSDRLTEIIFEDRLKEKWKNDLVLVHNPFARNPIKEKLFPTYEEWKCIFDENKKMFTITEIHNKNI